MTYDSSTAAMLGGEGRLRPALAPSGAPELCLALLAGFVCGLLGGLTWLALAVADFSWLVAVETTIRYGGR